MFIIIGKLVGGNLFIVFVEFGILLVYMVFLLLVVLVIWFILYKYNKVGNIIMYNFLMLIFGVILFVFLFGELIFEVKNLIVLVLVCIGIWIVNCK